MVRSPRIELGTPAWKAGVLPLNYDRSSADGDVFDGGRDRQASFGGLRDAAGGNPGQTGPAAMARDPRGRGCEHHQGAPGGGPAPPDWVCGPRATEPSLADPPMSHVPSPTRYSYPALYRRCGRSGLKLPMLSLGLWHNFGGVDSRSEEH